MIPPSFAKGESGICPASGLLPAGKSTSFRLPGRPGACHSSFPMSERPCAVRHQSAHWPPRSDWGRRQTLEKKDPYMVPLDRPVSPPLQVTVFPLLEVSELSTQANLPPRTASSQVTALSNSYHDNYTQVAASSSNMPVPFRFVPICNTARPYTPFGLHSSRPYTPLPIGTQSLGLPQLSPRDRPSDSHYFRCQNGLSTPMQGSRSYCEDGNASANFFWLGATAYGPRAHVAGVLDENAFETFSFEILGC